MLEQAGATQRIRRAIDRIDRWQRRHAAAAFPVAVVRRFGDDRGGSLAALIAYFGFVSIFPLLLVMTTVAARLAAGHAWLRDALVSSTLDRFPVVGPELGRNIGALHGSAWTIVIGLLAAIWSGIAVLGATEEAMNQLWDVPRAQRPPFVRAKLRALLMLAVLGFGTALTAACSVAATSTGWGAAGRIGATIGGVSIAAALFAATFRILTSRELSWRDVLPGALVAGVAWIGLQAVGSWLVDRQVRGASQLYGTFGVVLGLVGWLFLAAQLTILAAEINVVRVRRLWPRSLRGDETPADRRSLARQATEERAAPDEHVQVVFDRSAAPAPRV